MKNAGEIEEEGEGEKTNEAEEEEDVEGDEGEAAGTAGGEGCGDVDEIARHGSRRRARSSRGARDTGNESSRSLTKRGRGSGLPTRGTSWEAAKRGKRTRALRGMRLVLAIAR